MEITELLAILFAGIGIALVIASFGLAADFYGKGAVAKQESCLSKSGYSYVAIVDEDDIIKGYECLAPNYTKEK